MLWGTSGEWQLSGGVQVDAVVAALLAGPEQVQHLDLGDAAWATDTQYAKQLLHILRKYKRSLTSLRITMRALVQPTAGGMAKSQVSKWRESRVLNCRKIQVKYGCNLRKIRK